MKGKPKVKPKAKNPKSMRLGSLERQPSSPSAPLNNRRQSKNKGLGKERWPQCVGQGLSRGLHKITGTTCQNCK